MLAWATIQNMKNNYRTYFQMLIFAGIFLVASSAFAQKSNRRYTESEILAEAQFVEADALFLQGKYNESITKFKEFLLEHRDVAIAHFQLGRAYDAIEDHSRSSIAIQKAIELDPSNTWYLITQASMYEKNGQADKAAEVMLALIKTEPKSAFAYKKAAFYYLLSQMPDKAINILNQGQKQIGCDIEFCQRKHVIYLAKGDVPSAIKELQQIINHYPQNTQIRGQIANLFESINQPAKAEKQYREILKYDPFNAIALIGLQKRDIAPGSTDIKGLMTMMANPNISIDLKITEIVPIITKASSKASTAQKNQWIQLVQTLQKQHPNNAKAASVAGDMYNAIGEYDLALDAFKNALKKERSVYSLWQQTLELLFLKKQYEQVIKTANEALDYFPNKSKTMLYMAESKFRNNMPIEAIGDYKQASFMSGRNLHQKRFIYGRLAEIYLANNDIKKANTYLNKALKLDDEKDPYIQHVKKEIEQKQPILYDAKWIQLYPFGVFLI